VGGRRCEGALPAVPTRMFNSMTVDPLVEKPHYLGTKPPTL
jgi:hypothetical protein